MMCENQTTVQGLLRHFLFLWTNATLAFEECVQGGPSGRGPLFVDIKLKVPPQ